MEWFTFGNFVMGLILLLAYIGPVCYFILELTSLSILKIMKPEIETEKGFWYSIFWYTVGAFIPFFNFSICGESNHYERLNKPLTGQQRRWGSEIEPAFIYAYKELKQDLIDLVYFTPVLLLLVVFFL